MCPRNNGHHCARATKIRFYKEKIIDLISEKGQPFLGYSPEIVYFKSDPSYSPINLRYVDKSDWVLTHLYDCILQEKTPVKIIKEKVDNFKEEILEVEFNLEMKKNEGGSRTENDKKSYSERKEIVSKIISEVKNELNKDQAYKDFKAELDSLRKKAESISSRLSKYIRKYVSTVDI